MEETHTRFVGTIPEVYERYLVPLLFAPFAEDLAARVRDVRGTILETAAGTGVLTRALCRVLPSDVRVVATDLNEAMLRVAASRTDAAVTWKPADAQNLPFADAEFDAVVCEFGVMFFPDKIAGYREARRVLKKVGRFVFNVWDRLEANEASMIIHRTVEACFEHDPPQFFGRTPHGYYDVEAIRSELGAAGFAKVEIDPVDKVTLSTAHDAALALCQGTPLRNEIEERAAERLQEITKKARVALEARYGTGTFENRMRAFVVTAR